MKYMTSKDRSFDPIAAINTTLGVTGASDTTMEERYVIGVAVANDDVRSELISQLKKPSMFTTDKNRDAWTTILQMNNIGTPIEEITFIRELRTQANWEGNIDMYKEYIDRGNPQVAKEHAKYIYANYCVRQVKKHAKKISNVRNVSVDKIKGFLIQQMQLIDDLGRLLPSTGKELSDIFEGAVDMIENPKAVIPFPIKSLNAASGGMTKGHMSILGGRTGHGKTTAIVNLVDGWLKDGYVVRWYPREQSAEEMMQACIMLNADIDRLKVRNNKLTEEDRKKIRSAVMRMQKYYSNLVIKDDIDNMEDTMADIVSCKPKPDIVVDDFIQLINVQGITTGKRYEIEDILKKYHWLQKRFKFATLMASQLSRAVETRQFDNEPRISDLAEASFIEQLSENVILLWWEYKFLVEASGLEPNEIKFIFGKTRFGKTGYKILKLDERTGKLDA